MPTSPAVRPAPFDDLPAFARVSASSTSQRKAQEEEHSPPFAHVAARTRSSAKAATGRDGDRAAAQTTTSAGAGNKAPAAKRARREDDVDWDRVLREGVLARVVRPAVAELLEDLLGGADQDLLEFIMGKLEQRCLPDVLQAELADILDDEAPRAVQLIFAKLRHA